MCISPDVTIINALLWASLTVLRSILPEVALSYFCSILHCQQLDDTHNGIFVFQHLVNTQAQRISVSLVAV